MGQFRTRTRALRGTCFPLVVNQKTRKEVARRRGIAAEALAARSLHAAGWQILAQGVRVDGLEIDILALDPGQHLVAIEVRCRLALGDATPRELLGARKLAALQRQRVALPEIVRVDLLFVLGPPGGERLRLIRAVA